MVSSSKELPYWLALLRAPTVGPITFKKLVEEFPLLSEFFDNSLSHYQTLKNRGYSETFLAYLKNPSWHEVEHDLQWLEQSATEAVLLNEDAYPIQLKEIAAPPPILFVKGKTDLLKTSQIAMVGSRNPSPQGITLARQFAAQLAQSGLTITSGLALGIDAVSHGGALAVNGNTIAVMATGLDQIYPKSHRELAEKIVCHGALVTEFLPKTAPIAENFPRRNRVISGLALGVLVVEAALRSGSLITARFANEQGREVFAIPGAIHNPLAKGCHFLLRQGAKLVESIGDIMEEFLPGTMEKPVFSPPPMLTSKINRLAKDQQQLVECLNDDCTSIDRIIERSGLAPNKVASMLVELELQGLIVSVAGGYCRWVSDAAE
jgi:DNA processing protein